MGRKVACPACGHVFYVDLMEILTTCYECSTLFNPRKQSDIPEEDHAE